MSAPPPTPAAPAEPGTPARALLPLQVYRALRTGLHVLEGVATTTLVFPFIGPTSQRALVRRWSVRLLRVLGVKASVQGALASNTGNLLVVSNHISWLDIFVLNTVLPVRFVAKSELARWPVTGRMLRGAGTLFIDRERPRDALRLNHEAAAVLAAGHVVAIFAEGTTTHGNELLPFKTALLQPIVEAHGHVQPVALRYRHADGAPTSLASYVGDDPFLASFWRVCGARGLRVDLHATPPLPAGTRHRRELAQSAETAIRSVLGLPPRDREPGRRADRTGELQ